MLFDLFKPKTRTPIYIDEAVFVKASRFLARPFTKRKSAVYCLVPDIPSHGENLATLITPDYKQKIGDATIHLRSETQLPYESPENYIRYIVPKSHATTTSKRVNVLGDIKTEFDTPIRPKIGRSRRLQDTASELPVLIEPNQDRARSRESQRLSLSLAIDPEASRSRSTSRLAFVRSHKSPSRQSIIKLPETPDKRGRRHSRSSSRKAATIVRATSNVDSNKDRNTSHSRRKTYIVNLPRTPSPCPSLDIKDFHSPSSQTTISPATPDTPPQIRVNTVREQDQDRQSFKRYEKPYVCEETCQEPEDYYRIRPLSEKLSNRNSYHDSSSEETTNKSRRTPDTPGLSSMKPILFSLKPLQAEHTFAVPELTKSDSEHTTKDSPYIPRALRSGDTTILHQVPCSTTSGITAKSSSPVTRSAHKRRSRDTGSPTRTRKATSQQVSPIPIPHTRPSHRRTRSEAIPAIPVMSSSTTTTTTTSPVSPISGKQARPRSTYSYIPTPDLRAERRSYNTVRFLDSDGQRHEQLRRVLGI